MPFIGMCVWLALVLAIPQSAWGQYGRPGVTDTLDTSAIILKVREGFLPSTRAGTGQQSAASRRADDDYLLNSIRSLGVNEVKRLWTSEVASPSPLLAAQRHPGWQTYIAKLQEGTDPVRTVERISSLAWVEYAEIDRLFDLHEAPDDSLFERQWHLHNTGQPYWTVASFVGDNNDTLAQRTGLPGADVRWLAAHEHAGPRARVIVGVIDTGIDPEHEDLRDRMWANPEEIPDNGLDDDHNGFVDDVYGWDFSGDAGATPLDIVEDNDVRDFIGHGTHVAGTIAATSDNGIGIAGVSESARVFAAKMFPNSFFSVSSRSVYYAVARGAQVINMSWGGGFRSRALRDALQYAHDRGVVLVASMGNSGRDEVLYPSGYATTIGVGASDSEDQLAHFSTYNDFVDVTAPGVDVLSLRAAETDLFADIGEPKVHIIDKYYLISSGTSMAAPHVSGAAAAILSFAPGLTNEEVRTILRTSAVDILDPYGEGDNFPGYDRYTGAGRIDLERALALLPQNFTYISSPRPYEWVGGTVDLIGSAIGFSPEGYTIQIAPGHTPSNDDWETIAGSDQTVMDSVLFRWDSGDREGPYTLQLETGPDNRFDIRINLVQKTHAEVMLPSPGDTVHLLQTIVGRAVAPGFQSFQLSALGPAPSQTVHPIFHSSLPVWNDTLTLWRTDSLLEGGYELVLKVIANGDSAEQRMSVIVTDAFADGWPVTLPAVSHFAMTTANIDGAGSDEIVLPTTRGLWVMQSDGTPYPGWPRDTLPNVSSPPAIADLDYDGKKEIIVPGASYMHVYAFIGEEYEGWPQPFARGSNIYGGGLPTVGNVDGRGPLEILAVDANGRICIWNSDGSSYETESGLEFGSVDNTSARQTWLSCATVCDLNTDGRPEVIAAANDIHVFDGRTAKPYDGNPETRIASHDPILGMAIADFDGDGVRDIAYAAANEPQRHILLNIIDGHGVSLPGWPHNLTETLNLYLLYSIAAGDIDGDGVPEILAAPYSLGEGYLYAFHANGSPVGSDSTDGLLASLPGSVSSVGLIDIDDDSQTEIVVRVGEILSGPDRVYAFESDGALVSGYPLTFGYGSTPTPSTPVIGDVNHDGMADMVTVQSTDAVVTVWELGVPVSFDSRPWPRFRGDQWNTAVVPSVNYDVIHLARMISAQLRGSPQLPPYEPADLNCDGIVDVTDVLLLIDYLFRHGPHPCGP